MLRCRGSFRGVKGARRECVILLVEDSDDDVMLIRRAILRLGFTGSVNRVSSAAEAVDYLRHQPPYGDPGLHPPPDLIITDNTLGLMAGVDFIGEMRAIPSAARVPIILYSGILRDIDRKKAAQAGAAISLVKAGDMEGMSAQVRQILEHLPEDCQWGPAPA